MVLLLTCTALGIIALGIGVVLHLSLPFWQLFSGITAFPASRRENIRIPKLRRRLSVVYYGVGGVFLTGSVLLSAKTIQPEFLFAILPLLLFVALDVVWLLYRIYDNNVYTPELKRNALFAFLGINVLFSVFYFLSFYT